MDKYLKSCENDFWSNIFSAELEYTLRELKGTKDVLSVGCGPAVIETGLAEHGFNVTGLDISEEALSRASDSVRTIAGSAENMVFSDSSFDTVIYIASMQFIENYRQAVKETVRVLKRNGRILVMLLNTESEFFINKSSNPASYINRIKHMNLKEIERTITERFSVLTEYFLGVRSEKIFKTEDPRFASLYIIKGKRS
jgi:ubiquinone/menaquinone biosynthesis C-methylase UbiE